MIFIYYVTIFVYIFFLIFAVGPLVKKYSNLETSRKIIHTLLFFVWVLMDIFFKNTIHQVIIPIIFLILNTLSYKYNIYKSIERENKNHLGTIYFAIAITLIMFISYLYPSFYLSSGIAVFALTFGDGFAALMGYNIKSKEIYENKTIAGFIFAFLASLISIFIFSQIYCSKITILACLSLGLITAISELLGKGLDNFSIVLSTFLISYLFIYYPSCWLAGSIILSSIIFLIVFLSKSIDYYGSLLSMVIVFTYMYFGKFFGITILLAEYFFIFLIGIIRKKKIKEKESKNARNFWQILINGGIGTLFMVLYGIYHNLNLLIISIITVSGCFIDSVSSDVGELSSADPIDIFKGKRIAKGLSGGISFLGTIASLIGAFLIALYTYFNLSLNISDLFIIFVLIFLQTIIDSFLGSTIQVKYQCSKCKKQTEKPICCNRKTKKISGVSFVNNNIVNLLSSLCIGLLAIIIYLR